MLFSAFIDELKKHKISFCHWKSNRYLGQNNGGEIEYDLLVARADIHAFEKIICLCGFKRAIASQTKHLPSIHHFYGYDEEADTVIHIHAFYSLITGESLVKNYHFPFERNLFQACLIQENIPVPSNAAQLVMFVLRMMVKHGTIVEALLAWREYESILDELNWLIADDHVIKEACELLSSWAPMIDARLFQDAIDALREKSNGLRRLYMGRIFKKRLRPFRRYSSIMAFLITISLILRMLEKLLLQIRKAKAFPSGGAVIAFIGPEATGKTTLVTDALSFLNRFCQADLVHLGKPPATVFSYLPNLLLPFLRKNVPSLRTSRLEQESYCKKQEKASSLKMIILAIRSIMVAWDRRVLAAKVFRKAARGEIVICDRYPSQVVGAADSPRLNSINSQGILPRIYQSLMVFEQKIYASIVPPDYVVCLSVPVDVAVERNLQRRKRGKETEEYVRRRHAESEKLAFPSSIVYRVTTDKPLAESIREVRRIMWEIL